MLLLVSAALAGTVEVQTTTPTEVFLDGVQILRTFGPSTTLLSDVPVGEQVLVVYRDGEGEPLQINVPTEGVVRVRIGETLLETDAVVTPPDGPAPVVSLRSADGSSFFVVVDGRRLGTLSPDAPMSLDALGVGEHTVELRSTDMLVVWLRGTLHLQPGDDVRLDASEGRMLEVFGRPEAWQPGS